MDHTADFMPGVRGLQLSNPGVMQTVCLLGSLEVRVLGRRGWLARGDTMGARSLSRRALKSCVAKPSSSQVRLLFQLLLRVRVRVPCSVNGNVTLVGIGAAYLELMMQELLNKDGQSS